MVFMKALFCLQTSHQTWRPSTNRDHAFTLTELLVMLTTLAVLALLTLPTLAGVQNKSGRAQCANNLRQIGMASMIYANEYRGWLPIWGGYDSRHPINLLVSEHYTRYVWWSTPNSPVPTNGPAAPGTSSTAYQSMGYLYRAGLAGDGRIFYCPSQWGTPYGANAYTPLLTTDASGNVRSTYLYNPRMVNAGVDNLRRYQMTSQLEAHKLFAVDFLQDSGSQPGIDPSAIPHSRERGWNVLFTDGSVQFSQNQAAFFLITHRLITDESTKSALLYDFVFNDLEQDH